MINSKTNKFNIVKDFWFVLYVFLYVFNCPIISINTRTILDLINVVILFLSIPKDKVLRLNKKIVYLFAGFVPFFFYTLVMSIYHSMPGGTVSLQAYFSDCYTTLLVFVRVLMFVAVFLKICESKGYSRDDIFHLMIWVGLIQLFFVIFAFLVPSARSYFFSRMLTRFREDRALRISKLTQRSYGFAENLFDAFGYVVSLITAFSIIRYMNTRKPIDAVVFVLMFIPPMLNTRTGLVFDVIILAIVMLFNAKKFFSEKTIKIILLIIIGIIFLRYSYRLLPDRTRTWLVKGIESIGKFFFAGENEGVFGALQKDMVFPSNMVFGDGINPEVENVRGIDLGYVQCLWRFGIIGTILLLAAFLRMFIISFVAAVKKGYKDIECLVIICTVLFFVYLIKIYSIRNIGSYAVYMPIIILCMLPAEKEAVAETVTGEEDDLSEIMEAVQGEAEFDDDMYDDGEEDDGEADEDEADRNAAEHEEGGENENE